MTETPNSLGFHMPAEWAPHRRTWMMWPCRKEVWPDMEATRDDYVAVAQAIRDFEPVTMVVRPEDRTDAAARLGGDIDLVEMPLDDSWSRDSGPNFLVHPDGRKAAALFRFNAWGEKYHPYDADAAAGRRIAELTGVPVFQSDLVGEGGGISVDGEGTVITTRSCFPNRNRNPDWTEAEITDEIKAILGADKVIWLPGNVEETETDGHVDGVAVFVAPSVVLVEAANDPEDPWRAIKQANIDALRGQTDAKGRPLRLIEIPEADPACMLGDRFCLSYVNSYICNGAVIVPSYGVATDDWAREIYEEAFPDRARIPVPIHHIAVGGGGIHCITQQEP